MMTEFDGDELSGRVLESIRKKLLLEYRFLEPGLYRLKFKPWGSNVVATDGIYYYHSTMQTLDRFVNSKERDIELDYLHSIIHCIFLHPFNVNCVSNNYRIRNLAADICVSNIMCDFGITFDYEIMIWIERFKSNLTVLTVGSLSKYLTSYDESNLVLLEKLFKRDNHELWKNNRGQGEHRESIGNIQAHDTSEDEESNQGNETGECQESNQRNNTSEDEECNQRNDIGDTKDDSQDSTCMDSMIRTLTNEWMNAGEKIKMDLENFSSAKYTGDISSAFVRNIEAAVREKVNYKDFLMQFATYEEKMKLDLDEFDYVYYSYGMRFIPQKKIALIEPLEYKMDQVIKDFVIAIDTSGSCSGDIVKNFLIKSYNILKDIEKLNKGFNKINLHIIQCDCIIQEDMEIDSVDDFEQYMENFTVKGFGGTDFRPVFEYVDRLIQTKSLSNDLGGLIYFTDGYGYYPCSPPKYKTAIVFLDDDEKVNDFKSVPAWAIKTIISEI